MEIVLQRLHTVRDLLQSCYSQETVSRLEQEEHQLLALMGRRGNASAGDEGELLRVQQAPAVRYAIRSRPCPCGGRISSTSSPLLESKLPHSTRYCNHQGASRLCLAETHFRKCQRWSGLLHLCDAVNPPPLVAAAAATPPLRDPSQERRLSRSPSHQSDAPPFANWS